MTHGPIDPHFHDVMNELAGLLDNFFNPEEGKKGVGFFLCVYPHGDQHPAAGRMNYISNSDKLDVHAALKEIAAQIEGRLHQAPASQN